MIAAAYQAVGPDEGAYHGRGSQGPGWQETGLQGHDRASPPPRVIGDTLAGLRAIGINGLMTREEFGEYMADQEQAPRNLVLCSVDAPSSLPGDLQLPSPLFLCFLIWDAADVPSTTVSSLLRRLLDAGAVYICAFGSDCERVHDLADDEKVRDSTEIDDASCIPTTWHSSDSLDDAFWFFLFAAEPCEAYVGRCRTALVVSIGDHDRRTSLLTALRDPAAFCARVLNETQDDTAS